MKASLLAVLLSIVVDSTFGRLPPPINVNQLDYSSGRKENVPELRQENGNYTTEPEPLKCGAKLRLKCEDYDKVVIETPVYPLRYGNDDKCRWSLKMPEQSSSLIYCGNFQLNKGDYFFIGRQRYFGDKGWAYFEQPQNPAAHILKLKFKSNDKYQNTGFRCTVACWTSNYASNYETTTTTTTTATTDVRRDITTEDLTTLPDIASIWAGSDLTTIPNIASTFADGDASTWADRDLTTIPNIVSTLVDTDTTSTWAGRDLTTIPDSASTWAGRDLTTIPNIASTFADRYASTWADRDLTTIPNDASTWANRELTTWAGSRDLTTIPNIASTVAGR